jgi:hypothetical protein
MRVGRQHRFAASQIATDIYPDGRCRSSRSHVVELTQIDPNGTNGEIFPEVE